MVVRVSPAPQAVYLQHLKQGGADPGWLNEMTEVAESRGIVKKGIPMTRKGAEDLARECDELRKGQ